MDSMQFTNAHSEVVCTTSSSTTTLGTNKNTTLGHTSTTASTSSSIKQTTAAACEDDPNTNCAKLKAQCSDPRYDDLLNKHCQKTCGRCSVTSAPCFDASSECSLWNINGFCNNTFYTDEMKEYYCSKTCHFC
ncbi:shTK domain protein [Cooperia oncophora]